MPLADWLDDFFKDFTHYVADSPFESLVLFWRRVFFNSPNGVIHLVVDAEEHLKNVLRNFLVFKQVLLHAVELPRFVTNDSAHALHLINAFTAS
jgi:hypothetical protein